MTATANVPLLQARAVVKVFPGVRALDGVDFTLQSGEIHALIGENGAGKSTLIKVLTGVYPRDGGELLAGGSPIQPRSPADAERLGISTVYQEIHLLPALSIAENILLGRQPGHPAWIDWKSLRRRAAAALERVGLAGLDPGTPAGACSLAVQQLIAVARALDVQARVLILDEPTSSLDEQEAAALFALMRHLRGAGLGILFVTHFLDQVYAVSDRITILRNGHLAGVFPTAQLSRLDLVSHMLGKELTASGSIETSPGPHGHDQKDAAPAPLLEARGLTRRGAVENIDLKLHRGEALGLAGLLGSGRTETARLLFGADRRSAGAILIDGKPVPLRSPRDAIRHGMAFCSEDRKSEGIIPGLSVRDNLVLAMEASRRTLRRLSRAKREELAHRFIEALRIKTPALDTPIENLSGGNQQKVLLARWLCLEPSLFILDEPTRGIDVGAKVEIERLISRLRRRGRGVLFVSSDLEEVVRVCDRIAVLRDRCKAAELSGSQLDATTVMHTIAGADPVRQPAPGGDPAPA
ncbi:MAG TPA: sugar ABC transporter ATP-binding protein [Verrucomicrobiales bacterium]|nr:sugar ABC transporter ATP-binding protein [Verrucomicrobiales bacterium]